MVNLNTENPYDNVKHHYDAPCLRGNPLGASRIRSDNTSSTSTDVLNQILNVREEVSFDEIHKKQLNPNLVVILEKNEDDTYSAYSITKDVYDNMTLAEHQQYKRLTEIQKEVRIVDSTPLTQETFSIKPSNLFQRILGSNVKKLNSRVLADHQVTTAKNIQSNKSIHKYIVPPKEITTQKEVITSKKKPIDTNNPEECIKALKDGLKALEKLSKQGIYFSGLTSEDLVAASSPFRTAKLDCIDKLSSKEVFIGHRKIKSANQQAVFNEFSKLIPTTLKTNKEIQDIKNKIQNNGYKSFNTIQHDLYSALIGVQEKNTNAMY